MLCGPVTKGSIAGVGEGASLERDMMGYVKFGAQDPGVPRGYLCQEEERRGRCAEKGEQVGGIPKEG